LLSEPLFVGVSVTGPAVLGEMVKPWALEELKVRTIGPETPPPEGVIVTVPL
jgi:hypothetical protein